MMHECPKCGFVQPKDKYCANCGLDIESYKPAPDSLFVRLAKNTGLQIALVVLIIIGMAIVIFISQRERIAQHLSGALPTAKRTARQITEPKNQPDPKAALAAATRVDSTTPATALTAKSRPSPTASAPETKRYKDLTISFFEISKAAVVQLASEGQVLNETQQTKSFLVRGPDALARIREIDAEARPHGEPHTEAFTPGTPFNLDYTHMGGKKNPEAVGMSLVFNPTAMAESLWDFAVETNINLKNETGGALLSTTINGSYSIPPNSALFLAGFLPHQKVLKEDLWSFNGSPLMVYDSPDFISGLTEFVIVIQPK